MVGSIVLWAGSTKALMAKRYGHIGQPAKADVFAALDRDGVEEEAAGKEGKDAGKWLLR